MKYISYKPKISNWIIDTTTIDNSVRKNL